MQFPWDAQKLCGDLGDPIGICQACWHWAKQMITNEYEQPLQVFIRMKLDEFNDPEQQMFHDAYAFESIIYALIVCSIVPILIIYPFIQKYFAKGVNVGGVKE